MIRMKDLKNEMKTNVEKNFSILYINTEELSYLKRQLCDQVEGNWQ